MKRNNDSLYWQNIQLYSFGVAVNAIGLFISDAKGGAGTPHAFGARLLQNTVHCRFEAL